jgi:hypothetical protein
MAPMKLQRFPRQKALLLDTSLHNTRRESWRQDL